MIARMSSIIVKWLLHAGAISENDRELYEYAAYSFLFSLLPLILIMLLGCASGMLLEGVLMIVPFILVRKFSGGFHLQSPGVCFVSSLLLLSAFLFLIRLVSMKQSFILLSCLAVASTLQLFFCSPIDNEVRKLSEKERAACKKVHSTAVLWSEPVCRANRRGVNSHCSITSPLLLCREKLLGLTKTA